MSFFKRIDHYLLVNYPIVWRTKVHYFVVLFLVGRILSSILANVMFTPGQRSYFISTYSFYFLLLIFIFWVVSQARMKLPIHHFSAQVITFFTYMLCVCLLFFSLGGFHKTIAKRTAELVDISQLESDRQYLRSYQTQRESGIDNRYYRNAKVEEEESVQRDKIREILTRYYWLDEDKVFTENVHTGKTKKVRVRPILREIEYIEVMNRSVESRLTHCENYAGNYNGSTIFARASSKVSNQLGYVKCRLLGYYFLLFFSVLALLATQMKFRAFLGLLFLYLGLYFSAFMFISEHYTIASIFGITSLITAPITYQSLVFAIALGVSLMAVLGLQKNSKLRRFLAFFCVFCVPIVTINLVFSLVFMTNFSFNTLEYLVKALFVLIPAITALSTYLIVKKNVDPQTK